MTPDSPSPSQGAPLPPRHRPSLSTLAKDTMEDDLWSLDDDDSPATPAAPAGKPEKSAAPAEPPAEFPQEEDDEVVQLPLPPAEPAAVHRNEPKRRQPPPSRERLVPKLKASDDSRDDLGELADPMELGDWDEPATTGAAPAFAESSAATAVAAAPATSESQSATVPPKAAAPATGPAPARVKLTSVERIGLSFLAVALLVAGIWVIQQSIGQLPTTTTKETKVPFPQRGERMQVTRAETFWRAPVLSGPERDAVRRGTLLMPVIELDVSGTAGALRIFFRDGEGSFVGDSISRELSGEATFQIAATAGFDDLGMFAAYRTQRGEDWTVEVYEGPSVRAPLQEFSKLFEMPVSTLRR